MDNQREIFEVELSNDGGSRARGPLQIDAGPGQTLALPRPGSVETDTSKIRAEAQDDIAPNERPHAGVRKEQRGAVTDIGYCHSRAAGLEAVSLKRPYIFRQPRWAGGRGHW